MFMLFDIGQNINLIDSTLFEFFILFESSYFDDLDCILFSIKFISGSVYLSICTFTNYLVKSVVFDNSDHLIIKKIKNNFKSNYNYWIYTKFNQITKK